MIVGLAREYKPRKAFPVQVLPQRTLKMTMWTGTESVILQSSVSSSQKIVTASWTSRTSLNTSKKQSLALDDRITDKMTPQQGRTEGGIGASVPVGDTEAPVTGVIIEDRIKRFTGAGRSMENTGDRVGESDAHVAEYLGGLR